MIDLYPVTNFKSFYNTRQEFIDDKYEEASIACSTERPIDLDVELFQTLLDTETLFVFEIFKEEVFIGYTSVTVCPALLHKGKIDAYIDHLALDKEYRGQGVAKTIVTDIEEFLVKQGVDEIRLMLPATEAHDAFSGKLGYNKALTTHIKRLI